MASRYTPTPCRRCGGEKGPRAYRHDRPRYCGPCAAAVRAEHLQAHTPHWCGSCAEPRSCVTCARNKKQRQLEAAQRGAATRRAKQPGYFRPDGAERWWQQRCHSLVNAAIRHGLLPDLKAGEHACADCGGVAHEYDHRDYGRPFDVEPVCRSCNKQRGTASWPGPDRFRFDRLRDPSAHQEQDRAEPQDPAQSPDPQQAAA